MFWKKKQQPEFEAWQGEPGAPPSFNTPLPNYVPHVDMARGIAGQTQPLNQNTLVIAVGTSGQAMVHHGLSALFREAQVELNEIRLLILEESQYDFPLNKENIFRIPIFSNGQPDLESMGKKLQAWAGGLTKPRVYFCVDLSDPLSRFLPSLGGRIASEKEHFSSFVNRSVLIYMPKVQVQIDKTINPRVMLARLREWIRFSQPDIEHHMLIPELHQSVPQLFDDLFVVDSQAESALGEFLFCLLHPKGTLIHQQLSNLRGNVQNTFWARVSSFSIKTNKKEGGRLKAWTAWQVVDRILFGFETQQKDVQNMWEGFYSHLSADLDKIIRYFPSRLPYRWFFKENQDFASLPPTHIITDQFHKIFADWLRYAVNSCLAENGLSSTRQSVQILSSRLDLMIKKLGEIKEANPEAGPLWKAAFEIKKVCDSLQKEATLWDNKFHTAIRTSIKKRADDELKVFSAPDENLISEFIQEDNETLLSKFLADYSAMGVNDHRSHVAAIKWILSSDNKIKLRLDQQDFPVESQEGWLNKLYERAIGLSAEFAINQAGEITARDREYAVNSLREFRAKPFLEYSPSGDENIQKWSIVFSPIAFAENLSEEVFRDDYILDAERREVVWDIPRFTAVGIHYGIPINSLDFYPSTVKSYYENNEESRDMHFCREEIFARDLELKFKRNLDLKFNKKPFYSAQIVHTLWSQGLVSLFLRTFICGVMRETTWQQGSQLAWGIDAVDPFQSVQLSIAGELGELWKAYENFTINYAADTKLLIQKELRGENGKNPFSKNNRIDYWNALVKETNSKWVNNKSVEVFKKGVFSNLVLLNAKSENEKMKFLINMLELEMKQNSTLEPFQNYR